jgi:heme oxygenase
MGHSDRRFDLRNRTHAAHERLDAAVGAFSTLEDYRSYIACLSSFRAAMDEALRHISWPAGWHWQPTPVGAALREDAEDLGLTATDFGCVSARGKKDMDLSDPSALLGALYVLEGSTLGARLLKQRAAALGLDAAFGARHLALMSKDIAQWQSFLVLLDSAQDFNIDRAAASANSVFAIALRCFESELLVVH